MLPTMTDDELRPVLDELRKFEGLVLHLYLDDPDDDRPNVTIGIGCLITDAAHAQRLPFRHRDGLPASPAEIAAEFARVQSAPHHHPASYYAGDLFITEADAYALGCVVLRASLVDLVDTFPGWPSFELPARQCLLDVHWNAGSLRHVWPHLLAACNAVPPNYEAAADQCETANPFNRPARAARNAWRRGCMLAAQAAADSVESAPDA